MKPLLVVKEIGKSYKNTKVLDGINFEIEPNETLGLVGESGCGKSTLGKIIMNLLPATTGTIFFDGQDIRKQGRSLCKQMQIIFQDPYASLNPRMSVEQLVGEPLFIHHGARGKVLQEKVVTLLEQVGLESSHLRRFPHEFSGGQRQRVCIARALAIEPRFLVCDEPVSALDASTQDQVITLFQQLKYGLGLTFLFISHDLTVVREIADRVAVMYCGKLLEIAPAKELFAKPTHPYTQALLSAIPVPDPILERKRQRLVLIEDLPLTKTIEKGCSFQNRCPHVFPLCREKDPEFTQIGGAHSVKCHLAIS